MSSLKIRRKGQCVNFVYNMMCPKEIGSTHLQKSQVLKSCLIQYQKNEKQNKNFTKVVCMSVFVRQK